MNLAEQVESGSSTPSAETAVTSAESESTQPSSNSTTEQRISEPTSTGPGGSDGSTEKPRIRIGSQRERYLPRVTPKPGFDPSTVRLETPSTSDPQPTAPTAAPAIAASAPPAVTAPPMVNEVAPAASNAAGSYDTGTPAPAAIAEAPAAPGPVADELTGRRSRRDRRQREVVPEERVAHTVDVPNLRRGLTPEQQAEFDAALAGVEVESLLGAPATINRAGELAPDTRLTGRIVGVHRDSVFVDVGRQHQGIVPLRQFAEPPSVGSDLEVIVSRFDADEGLYTLSVPGGAVSIGDW